MNIPLPIKARGTAKITKAFNYNKLPLGISTTYLDKVKPYGMFRTFVKSNVSKKFDYTYNDGSSGSAKTKEIQSVDFTEIVEVTNNVKGAGNFEVGVKNEEASAVTFDISPPEFLVDLPIYLGCYRNTANDTGTINSNH